MHDAGASLRDALERRTLILDGATGTELERRGVATPLPLWSARALLDEPDTVAAIHRDYAAAGADIVVANTFRTNPRTLRSATLTDKGAELNRIAIGLARKGVASAQRPSGSPVRVVASIAPVEDCYRPQRAPDEATLRAEHEQMAEWLAAAGANLLWIETMGTVREARAAAQAAQGQGLPFVVSFVPRESGELLSGERLEDGIAAVEPLGPLAIGLNCIPPVGMTRLLPRLRASTERPLAAYAHIGNAEPIIGWSFAQTVTPEEYAGYARQWQDQGARIIGGCCGTTPAHIRTVRGVLAAGA